MTEQITFWVRLIYGYWFMREAFSLGGRRWWLHPVAAFEWFHCGMDTCDAGGPEQLEDGVRYAAEEEAWCWVQDR